MVMTNVTGGKNTGKGRRKIEIKKIEEANNRQVTFSKRRAGLFKKASELCVLTGSQIAVLVHSPGGRVFAFGHPTADVLIDRYIDDKNKDIIPNTSSDTRVTQKSPPPPPVPLPVREFNQHYVEVSREVEAEKKRREMIPVKSDGIPWYDEPTDGLDVEELEQYLRSLEELKKKVVTRADELMMIKRSPALLGSNMFEIGWNNNLETIGIASSSTVHGSFNFGHGGDQVGNF